MIYDNWKEAAEELRARSSTADQEQIALANQLGVKLPARMPAIVAAVRIREHLAGPLRTDPSAPVTQGQLEYLGDLVDYLGILAPRPIETRLQASAWIEVLECRRALEALKRLKPARGDVVASTLRTDEVGVVVSISGDGRINIAGPGGRGIRAHIARIEARAHETDQKAEDARQLARNRAALRTKSNGPPSSAAMAILAPHRVDTFPDRAEVELLREAIEASPDERPVQECLRDHPSLLARLVGLTSYGTYVRSQVALGSQLIPDFLLGVGDSGGVHWTLIELESPKAQVAIKGGRLAGKAREGTQQVEDWREWLLSNLDYARRTPNDNGLGLVEIRPESPGIVIIGRRDGVPTASLEIRHRLRERRNIALHSYDWLLEAVDPNVGVARPGGPLDWSDWRDRI